jgi:two-component system, OmpR family, KDP operon response regulator KdpE
MAAILVIEDDEFFQGFLEIVLTGEGHDVTLCSDGEAGIAAAKEAAPDMVLCDLSMPKMTGYEVIGELRKIDGFSDVPIVALSAHDKAEDRDEVFNLGGDGFLTKPVEVDRLTDCVRKALAGELPPPGT